VNYPARPAARAPQAASAVLMVRPAVFYGNPDTAASNAFQTPTALARQELTARARREFDAVAQALDQAGVQVCVVAALAAEDAPDALFPNNWISTAADGTVTLYPLHAANRRRERRRDIVQALREQFGFAVDRVIDLSGLEAQGHIVEGTGSLVLDHEARIAYVCVSARSTDAGVAAAADSLGCQAVAFGAGDEAGRAIYHTNVMLGIGGRWAVVCLEAIADGGQRRRVADRLSESHELIAISRAQMREFCGNVLELRSGSGTPLLAVSERAWAAYTPAQRAILERHARPVAVAIPTIEGVGGGGIRCLLAEIFLARRSTAARGPGV
jgi:hypothetical protein